MKISVLRRIILLAIMVIFILQFFKIKILVGSLSGSVALWSIALLDIFTALESQLASRDFSQQAFIAVIPLIVIYLIFGRAFCGWVCPMDFFFEIINRARNWRKIKVNISPKIGYLLAFLFLAASFFAEIPLFSNYLSHLTNFFRMLSSSVFLYLNVPIDVTVFYFSAGIVFLLLGLEYFFPRLWCKVLCPIGKIYGMFNKVSLLRLKFNDKLCSHCGVCEKICYMDVKISSANKQILRDSNCIYCGKCIEGCSEKTEIIKMNLGWRN